MLITITDFFIRPFRAESEVAGSVAPDFPASPFSAESKVVDKEAAGPVVTELSQKERYPFSRAVK
ncbi:hypothetical protein [Wolbachia endosymbiont of Ctenocephalides felis wCfeT]|uniref:hypothetical protein n=1 Tax=Wolbachia endosymbiont of Ctenocephalides felis wCfeT TaxID=2732593 RepID=UPI001445EF30|nr:hypothetical protein [Wolbachia endosymbiont of Ctenocephalides felis wCfeT]